MQSVLTLTLVRSAHRQWDALRDSLASLTTVRIADDVPPTQPLCVLAGCHPTAMLVDADLVDRPAVPLARDLRALSPESKIILLGATATLDGPALITLQDQGIAGYLVWEELRPKTVRRALALVVDDDVLVASPIVLATLRTALERRRGARRRVSAHARGTHDGDAGRGTVPTADTARVGGGQVAGRRIHQR